LPNAWFADLPETAYRAGAAALGVAPQSLGAGYVVFYFYSSIIGILAIGLSLWLVQRQDFFDALKRDNHAESKVADEEPQRA
jgi:PAT family beta-lactamase induction signal transducer AmpG